jgi:hypothetical protein
MGFDPQKKQIRSAGSSPGVSPRQLSIKPSCNASPTGYCGMIFFNGWGVRTLSSQHPA